MTCKLCGLSRPLIKAHIIPRPFFSAYGTDGAPKVLSNTKGVHPKRVRTGFYDNSILCASCDRRLGVWDQYGSDLFLNQAKSFRPYPSSSDPIGFVREAFDYRRLRLFVLSVLWRASVSSLPMFNRVALGPYEDRLCRLIAADDPGATDDFCTVLSAFTVNGAMPADGVPIMDPFRERWNGTNAYRLSFGLVTAYIKVDRASFPTSFRRLALRNGEPLLLISRDFSQSSEASLARAIARAPQNRRAFRRL